MTTKGPSHKQIIIPMTNELGKRFTKDLASHITNINCILKNIKSNICADYISSDNKDVNIVTNNVASSSNLQKIENTSSNPLMTIATQLQLQDYHNLSLISRLLASYTTSINQALTLPLRTLNTSSRTLTSLTRSFSLQGQESSKYCLSQI